MLVILECVKSESDLLAIEKALAGGLDAEVLKARLSSGLSVHEAINFKG